MPICDYEGYVDDDEEEDAVCAVPINPAWEQQQKKTFTAWCNAHLRNINLEIKNFDTDFCDGLMLIKLLEAISGEQLQKPDRGRMRVHKIANVNKGLKFIESKDVKLVSIGAEEIVDGNVKMTLGMIWTVILRFAIQDIQIGESTAKEGLLLWCKRQTASYKNVKVENFHTSFKDGLAFCALIHRHRPEHIDYNSLKKENCIENLNLAFDVADKKFDIPRMLDPEDMVNCVKCDERSVMTYLSYFYHVFAGESRANMAAKLVSSTIGLVRDNEMLMKEYGTLSSNLLAWIKQKLKDSEFCEPQTSVAAVENLQQKFRHYRRQEKPLKLREKATIETSYNTLQTRARLNKGIVENCIDGCMIMEINTHWMALEKADKSYEDWLFEESQRLGRVEYLCRKFDIKCSTEEAWIRNKPETLSANDYLSANLSELRAIQKRYEAFQSDMEAHSSRVARIKMLLDELRNLEYHDVAKAERRYNKFLEVWRNLEQLSISREENIKNTLTVLEKIDKLHLEFAKRAAVFNNWLEQTEDDLCDTFIVHTLQEIQALIDAHDDFERTLLEAEQEFNYLQERFREVEKICDENHLANASDNPYTDIKPQELPKRWKRTNELSNDRKNLLHNEMKRQQANDRLQHEFAEKAKVFNVFIETSCAEIKRVMESEGTLEEQRKNLEHLESELNKEDHTLNQLEQYNQALEDAYVYENPYTVYSMPTLRVAWEQLFTSVHYGINEINNQILTRDSRCLSAEYLKELRASFKHFDKNNSGALDANEFKACLVSLGHTFKDDVATSVSQASLTGSRGSIFVESDFSNIMNEVDPSHTGYVTFDAFLSFITQDIAGDASETKLIQSFRTMCGDKGYLTAKDLSDYLSPEDVAYCLERMKPVNGPAGDPGALNYELFVSEHFAREGK